MTRRATARPSPRESIQHDITNSSRYEALIQPKTIVQSPTEHQRGHPLMVRLCGWNVRGLNWPNKQEDLKIFLQLHNLGFVGLFETKITMKNVKKIANRLFQGWRWEHNFSHSPEGRIWKPGSLIPSQFRYCPC